MGYVTIEDYDGEVETVVFPSVWETVRPILAEDAAVAIRGRVQANERDVRVLAEEIIPLDKLRASAPSPAGVLHLTSMPPMIPMRSARDWQGFSRSTMAKRRSSCI